MPNICVVFINAKNRFALSFLDEWEKTRAFEGIRELNLNMYDYVDRVNDEGMAMIFDFFYFANMPNIFHKKIDKIKDAGIKRDALYLASIVEKHMNDAEKVSLVKDRAAKLGKKLKLVALDSEEMKNMPTLTEYYAQVEEQLAKNAEELSRNSEELSRKAEELFRKVEELAKSKEKHQESMRQTIKKNLVMAQFHRGTASPEVIESFTNASKDLQNKIVFVPDDEAYEIYLVEMIIKAKDMLRDERDFNEVQQLTGLSSSAIEMINNSLDAKIFDYLADLEKIAWE
jgi:hypothetical protein